MAEESISPARLASLAGVSKGYISKILGGSKSNLSADVTEKLATALGRDVAWIIGQETEHSPKMVEFPNRETEIAGNSLTVKPGDISLPGKQAGTFQRIRLVPILAYVQGGQAIDFETVPLQDHEVVPSTCRDPKSFALILRGISMEPLYSEDDVIIVSPAKEKRFEGLVVAQLGGVGATFKLLDVPSAKGMIRLTAYNPAFAPVERPEEDFDWVHAVHSVIRYARP